MAILTPEEVQKVLDDAYERELWCPACEEAHAVGGEIAICPYCGAELTSEFPESDYKTYERENPR